MATVASLTNMERAELEFLRQQTERQAKIIDQLNEEKYHLTNLLATKGRAATAQQAPIREVPRSAVYASRVTGIVGGR